MLMISKILDLLSAYHQCRRQYFLPFHVPKPTQRIFWIITYTYTTHSSPTKVLQERIQQSSVQFIRKWKKDEENVSTSKIRWSHSSSDKKPLYRKTLWQENNVNSISKDLLILKSVKTFFPPLLQCTWNNISFKDKHIILHQSAKWLKMHLRVQNIIYQHKRK